MKNFPIVEFLSYFKTFENSPLVMPGFSTNLIHGANHLNRVPDVAPPINVSTTFRYDNDPEKLVKLADKELFDILGTPYYLSLIHI